MDALGRAWEVLEPIWIRAASVLDREVERISVALARAAEPLRAIRTRVGEKLLLQPLLAPSHSSGWTDDYDDVCIAVRYSVPGTWRVFEGQAPPPASLAALIGPPRATILRYLDRPATAGELAQVLHGRASMATHHLAAMEKAGARDSDATCGCIAAPRGTELAALYDRE